jgi:hypothetical protein
VSLFRRSPRHQHEWKTTHAGHAYWTDHAATVREPTKITAVLQRCTGCGTYQTEHLIGHWPIELFAEHKGE